MPIIQEQKFKRKDFKKSGDVVTLWLNDEERAMLENAKNILEQEKDGTAIKQLAYIGAKLLGSDQMTYILETIYSNKRKNKRMGVVSFD